MILGCVADDFTGAGDAASFLQAGGARVVLCNGIPESRSNSISSAQAVVIALKTRSCTAAEAVDQSLKAFSWLKEHGAGILYFKYCSTFDSTDKGNIGPVLDAVLEKWSIPYTILCPSLLENGRWVKGGRVYVNGVLLDESPMKDHPLNPMDDSRLKVLMERQSRFPCYELPAQPGGGSGGENRAVDRLERYRTASQHFYIIPDYYEERHGKEIAEEYGGLPLLSGGSGLLKMLAESWKERGRCPDGNGGDGRQEIGRQEIGRQETAFPAAGGAGAMILSGSCSRATRMQIQYYQSQGGAILRIHPLQYVKGYETMGGIQEFLDRNKDRCVLIYTSASPDEIRHIKKEWEDIYPSLDTLNEQILAETAAYGLMAGRKKIIVAGGETSGAVMQRLKFRMFDIGDSIAPGVPVMIPEGHEDVKLILKSGNFGGNEFFLKAIEA